MKKIKNYTDCNGNCSRCGNCCTMAIPITRKEEKRIRKYIIENNIFPENLIENNNFYANCCFFDRKNKCCKIYSVRPQICKTFKCNRDEEQLELEKIKNHNKAYWNCIDKRGIHNVTTFDLLFYDNPEPLLRLLISQMNVKTKSDYEKMLIFLEKTNQHELAKSLSVIE